MKACRYRAALVVVLLIFLARSGEPCSPTFTGLVFTRPHGPDAPISQFTKGQIGIPLPTWWRAYLVVAYRYMEGKPLSPQEARSFEKFWSADQAYGNFVGDPNAALNRWMKVRGRFRHTTAPGKLAPYKETTDYSWFINCPASAFLTAAETLEERVRRFGAGSAELQLWIDGQDAVFQNCEAKGIFPELLPANADPLLRADRAYQVAAIHFYSKDYSKAKAEFDTIGQGAASPWRPIAPYLAARAILRQAFSGSGLDAFQYDERLLKEADGRFKKVLSDPSQKAWHNDARRMINLIAFRLEPMAQQHRLAAHITHGGIGADFGQEVRDYTLLLDKYLDDEPDFPGVLRYDRGYDKKLQQWRREQYQAKRRERSDELTDWIMTFQSDSPAARQHALAKWRTTHSTPWLFMAAAKLSGNEAAAAEVLEGADEIGPDAAAFAAFSYQKTRLMREKGDLAGARQAVREALAHKDAFSLSTINLLQDEQMKVADQFEGFLGLLARQPVKVTNDWYDPDEPSGCYLVSCKLALYGERNPGKNSRPLQQFDPATAVMLNTSVPTEVLARVVNTKALPDHLQKAAAPAVWARAGLLDQSETAASVAAAAVAARPELERFVREYANAHSPEERRFITAFAVAHFPGLRPFVDSIYPRESEFAKIDNYRDNWWCADVGGIPDAANYEKEWITAKELRQREIVPVFPAPAFLSAGQTQAAEGEWQRLMKFGAAEDYLPRILISWAKAHPEDPRVPEALHFSSRVSRYACGDQDSRNNFSREAFMLLHKKYPHSEWTKKTRFWF